MELILFFPFFHDYERKHMDDENGERERKKLEPTKNIHEHISCQHENIIDIKVSDEQKEKKRKTRLNSMT